MNLLIVLFKLVVPLLKEYGLSNLRMQNSNSTFIAKTVAFVAILLQCLMVLFLAEQSTNNLELHRPIVEQYKAVVKKAETQEIELKESQVRLFQCQMTVTSNSCLPPPTIKSGFHYDPDKKIMVVDTEIKQE